MGNSKEEEPIRYSEKYYDNEFEYRHVVLPTRLKRFHTTFKLYSESEWRDIGVVMSPGWQHYAIHRPEPNILLFKRPLKQPANSYITAPVEKAFVVST